jgi:hypothetical protein
VREIIVVGDVFAIISVLRAASLTILKLVEFY